MDEEKNLAEVAQPEAAETPELRRKNTNSSMNASHSIRALAVGYILYLLFKIVKAYFEGGAEAPSLWLLLLAIAVLGGGALLIVILTIRDWRAGKNEE